MKTIKPLALALLTVSLCSARQHGAPVPAANVTLEGALQSAEAQISHDTVVAKRKAEATIKADVQTKAAKVDKAIDERSAQARRVAEAKVHHAEVKIQEERRAAERKLANTRQALAKATANKAKDTIAALNKEIAHLEADLTRKAAHAA